MTSKVYTWEGREVEFREYTIKAFSEVQAAFAKDRALGSWHIAHLSTFYKGTDEQVFPSVEYIQQLPARKVGLLSRLVAGALEVNQLEDPDEVTAPLA